MAHWSDYLTRGLLAFLSLNHLGTAVRCFFDEKFFQIKLFHDLAGGPMQRLFGIYALINGLILLQSAIYLYLFPLTRLVWFSSFAYLALFLLEHHVYHSIQLHSGLVFSLICHSITIVWLAYFHTFKPFKAWPHDVESESLLNHGLPIAKQIRKRTKFKKS